MNTHTILEYFADGDKKIIIDSISDSPKTIKSILKHCKLPKTSWNYCMSCKHEKSYCNDSPGRM